MFVVGTREVGRTGHARRQGALRLPCSVRLGDEGRRTCGGAGDGQAPAARRAGHRGDVGGAGDGWRTAPYLPAVHGREGDPFHADRGRRLPDGDAVGDVTARDRRQVTDRDRDALHCPGCPPVVGDEDGRTESVSPATFGRPRRPTGRSRRAADRRDGIDRQWQVDRVERAGPWCGGGDEADRRGRVVVASGAAGRCGQQHDKPDGNEEPAPTGIPGPTLPKTVAATPRCRHRSTP